MNSTNTTQRPYVVGVFEKYDQAEKAIKDLLDAGFTRDEIGFAMRGNTAELDEGDKAEAYGNAALARTTTGAVAGSLLGGTLGAITSLLIPGFGAVLLSGILVMAAGGAVAGGFAGLISTMQLSDEEKLYYKGELEAGRCIVVVRTPERYSEALAVLTANGARDLSRQQPA